MAALANALHLALAQLKCHAWWEYVPSQANGADFPSRPHSAEASEFYDKEGFQSFEVPREGDGRRIWLRARYDRESQQAQMIAFRVMNRRRSRLRIFCASFVVLVFSYIAPVSGQVDAAAQKEGIKLTQQLGPLNQVCTGFSENVAGPIKRMLPYNIFYSQGQSFFPAPFCFMRLALTPGWQPQGGLAVHAPSSMLFLLVRPSKHSPVMEGQLMEHPAHMHRLLH